jgi:FAD:protein FMN transferase
VNDQHSSGGNFRAKLRRICQQKQGFVLLLCLVGFVSPALFSQAAPANLLRYEASVEAMGGTFTVSAYGPKRSNLEAAVTAALEEAHRLDGMLSNYKPASEWSVANREAAKGPYRISKELFDLLAACLDYSQRSEGTFDITVGPLMRRWGFFKGAGRLPHRAELREAMDSVGYKNIVLDRQAQTIRFTKAGTEMDPGGVGKGYAVDRMVAILRDGGIDSAFVSAAGSSLYGLGSPPGEKGWKVTIRHPAKKEESVGEVFLKDQSMATSGSSEKYFMAGGNIYSHIMDPRTGYPAQGTLSVTLVGPRALDTEVWAKPLYIHGREWAARNKPKEMRVLICPEGPRGQKWETKCEWLQ